MGGQWPCIRLHYYILLDNTVLKGRGGERRRQRNGALGKIFVKKTVCIEGSKAKQRQTTVAFFTPSTL